MKTLTLLLLAVMVLVGAAFLFGFTKRNQIITLDEAANASWANVQTQYQRRLDLIPNLVETVKGAGTYEGTTLIKITEGRNQILGVAKEMRSALDSQDIEKVESLERTLIPAIRAYAGLAQEAYPSLKATEQYQTLMAQLEGTENRIAVARRDYNLAVAAMNTLVRTWGFLPLCGSFKTRSPFQAEAAAEQAPKVKF